MNPLRLKSKSKRRIRWTNDDDDDDGTVNADEAGRNHFTGQGTGIGAWIDDAWTV